MPTMQYNSPIVQIQDPILKQNDVQLWIKRDDLIHPLISGNKWRKLKYNLRKAQQEQVKTLLTFGGAFSNHIYSFAAACQVYGFQSIGVIRGEADYQTNPTLSFAKDQGMQLHFVDRATYRDKNAPALLNTLREQYGEFMIIPEGGSNELGVKGCEEIISEISLPYDVICTACGTGGTISGLINGLQGDKQIVGFSALKGNGYIEEEVSQFVSSAYSNWEINYDYHFGGYAKLKPELVLFVENFYQKQGIQLEYIYTGKMMYGIYDLIQKGFFPKGSKIIALHTGGLQGIAGMQVKIDRLKNA